MIVTGNRIVHAGTSRDSGPGVVDPAPAPNRGPETVTCGDDPTFRRYVGMIDDLMIVAAVGDIDGPGGTLGQAGPCQMHVSS